MQQGGASLFGYWLWVKEKEGNVFSGVLEKEENLSSGVVVSSGQQFVVHMKQ